MQALFSRKLQAMQKNRMPAIRWELAHIRIASILFFYRATARDRGDSRGCMAWKPPSGGRQPVTEAKRSEIEVAWRMYLSIIDIISDSSF